MMLLSSAPSSAAEVAKPDLKLCPEYLFGSNPAIAVYFFIKALHFYLKYQNFSRFNF